MNIAAVSRAFDYVFSLSTMPRVINMSFGGGESAYAPGSEGATVEAKIDKAYRDYGIVSVAASGDFGVETFFYPAMFENVLSVSAVDRSGRWYIFSTFNDQVNLCAPGDSVFTTKNPKYADGQFYGDSSGTSVATPQASAAALLVVAQNPSFSAEQVVNKLESTARRLSAMDGFHESEMKYGSGAVDAATAVGWTAAPAPPAPEAGVWPLARDIVYPEVA